MGGHRGLDLPAARARRHLNSSGQALIAGTLGERFGTADVGEGGVGLAEPSDAERQPNPSGDRCFAHPHHGHVHDLGFSTPHGSASV